MRKDPQRIKRKIKEWLELVNMARQTDIKCNGPCSCPDTIGTHRFFLYFAHENDANSIAYVVYNQELNKVQVIQENQGFLTLTTAARSQFELKLRED